MDSTPTTNGRALGANSTIWCFNHAGPLGPGPLWWLKSLRPPGTKLSLKTTERGAQCRASFQGVQEEGAHLKPGDANANLKTQSFRAGKALCETPLQRSSLAGKLLRGKPLRGKPPCGQTALRGKHLTDRPLAGQRQNCVCSTPAAQLYPQPYALHSGFRGRHKSADLVPGDCTEARELRFSMFISSPDQQCCFFGFFKALVVLAHASPDQEPTQPYSKRPILPTL